MPVKKLDLEIWKIIIDMLHQPKPRIHDKPERKSIRQPALAAMMRVNSAMHDLAGLKLYHQVIIDDMDLYLADCDTSNLPSTVFKRMSKSDLVRLTESLYIEYPELPGPGTYPPIFSSDDNGRKSAWKSLDPAHLINYTTTRSACREWCSRTTQAFKRAKKFQNAYNIFGNLRTVAFASILGGRAYEWSSESLTAFQVNCMGMELLPSSYQWPEMRSVTSASTAFVLSTPATYMCVRTASGPYSCLPLLVLPPSKPDMVIINHFSLHDHFVPIYLNVLNHWWQYLHKGENGSMTWSSVKGKTEMRIRAAMGRRDLYTGKYAAPGPLPLRINLNIGAPDPKSDGDNDWQMYYLDANEDFVISAEEDLRKALRTSKTADNDLFVVGALHCAPDCLACEWKPLRRVDLEMAKKDPMGFMAFDARGVRTRKRQEGEKVIFKCPIEGF